MTGLRDTISKLNHLREHLKNHQTLATLGPKPAFDKKARAVTLREITDFGANPGNLRMYAATPLHLPPNAPLVVALHGCTQTAADYDYGSGWSLLAEQHGFAVVFAEQQSANNPNRCFNWFNSDDTTRGHGEVASIREMVAAMISAHHLDAKQVYVVGLSAGGAMAASMLAAYPDVFAGGGIIAGLPHGAATSMQGAFEAMGQAPTRSPEEWGAAVRAASPHRGQWPKISIWQGSADPIVNPRNADNLAAQWTDVHGLAPSPHLVTTASSHTRQTWLSRDGDDAVEVVTIAGMGHGVPIAPADGVGMTSAYHFDVGVASSVELVKYWGVVGLAVSPKAADAKAQPAQLTQLAIAKPSQATANAPEPVHARSVITAALRRASLLVPEGAEVSPSDPRAIIAKTLRSVGLLDP